MVREKKVVCTQCKSDQREPKERGDYVCVLSNVNSGVLSMLGNANIVLLSVLFESCSMGSGFHDQHPVEIMRS